MDENIKTMLNSYIDAFNSFPCDNEKVNAEIEAFKKDLTEFAESATDMISFMADYNDKGYGKRYIDLFGKIAQVKANELTVEEIETRQQQITPKTFVAQYNTAYDAIKACKYRKKAEQAYQNIFDLAEQYNDMLDFNIESEKRNLLFKLSADDAIEQAEFIAQASDPLDKIVYPQYAKRIANWHKAQSDADITYYSEIEQIETSQNSICEQQKMTIISAIAVLVLEFVKAKHNILTATKDKTIQSNIAVMIKKRNDLKYLFAELLPQFGLDWNTILNDKFYRRFLLAPSNLDITGRIKMCLHSQNFQAINEIIQEEMLTDIPVDKLVFRPANTPISYSLDRRKGEVETKYEKIAQAMNAELDYYKYVLTANSAPEFEKEKTSGFMKFFKR